jgi:SlyX protein
MNDRITELEIKLAHQEKLIDELNEVVTGQWKDIDILKKKFVLLNEMIKQFDTKNSEADESPPHF